VDEVILTVDEVSRDVFHLTCQVQRGPREGGRGREREGKRQRE